MMLFLLACPTPDGNPDDWGYDEDEGFTALIQTTSSDYSTGALATRSEAGTLRDAVVATPADTVVRVEGTTTWVLSRSSEDTVTGWSEGDFSAPSVEFSTGNATNPQDAATCGGKLYVTMLAADHLGVYDPLTGLAAGTVDLTPWSDEDGSPEAKDLVVASDGYLYVALQQLDYVSTYASLDGSGTLVKVDCATMEVVDAWDVGPNPNIAADTGDVFYVYGGDYYLPDYSGPELDGGVWPFDPSTGTLGEPLLLEEEVGANIGNFAVNAEGRALLTYDDGYSWSVRCLDLGTGAATEGPDPDAYVSSAATAPDGTIWLAQRQDFAGGASVVGTVIHDPATCEALETATTTFPPASLAFLP